MTALLLALSTIFLLISPIAYVVSIIRGKSRPHRLTRLAVMAALLLSFFAALDAHANPGTLVLASIFAVQGVVIFLMSLWRGMGGGSLFDWVCFALAILGLIVWQVSDNPVVGIWFAVFADLLAFVPAFVKTWKHPHTEGHWFYTLAVIGTVFGLFAYPLSAASVFQIYAVVCQLVMLLCIYHRRIFNASVPELVE